MWKDKLRAIKEHMNKLHMKLTIFFILLVCVIMLIESYRYNLLKVLVDESEAVFTASEKIILLNDKVDAHKENYENYLASKLDKDIERFNKSKKELLGELDSFKIKGKYTDQNIKSVNLYNMTMQYIEHLDNMVKGKEKITNSNVNEATKLYQYISEYSNELMGEQLEADTKQYNSFKVKINQNSLLSRVLEVFLFAISIVCIALYSICITNPIKRLAKKTKSIADGNYNLSVYDEEATGEVGELFDSFNEMTQSIRNNVDEIKRSRMLEQALAKEKINNLNIQKALKEAEYTSLQAQVNPHFIFNTINIGAQLAMLNDDDSTCEYLQNAAELFRYNLNGLDGNISLDKEIENVDNYINVMQTRYGDCIEYNKRLDHSIDINEIVLPKMTLQPLVEFLYINSVNTIEEGGIVKILVNQNEKYYIIDILSSGKEIEQKVINSVMLDDLMLDEQTQNEINNKAEVKEYYMSVLGVRNSIKRLRLLYERKDVIFIRRDEEINYVTIKIPVDVQRDEM
ncbi:MAG: HAMP domain-containing protein [Lachnospiraceae bacterium]|nr:HAMP domain-containing protein [Lachnospiraceae bacterium]